SILSANPGATKPALRPEAFQAIRWASSTATDQPRRASSRATVSPASPPPMTQASTSMSCESTLASGAGTIVAAYQLGPKGVGSAIAPRIHQAGVSLALHRRSANTMIGNQASAATCLRDQGIELPCAG